VEARETIRLPGGYNVQSLPQPVFVKTKEVELEARYSASLSPSDPRVEFNKRFLINSREFDPESYSELRRVLDANAGTKKAEVLLGLPH
jgi:hypothetical protein